MQKRAKDREKVGWEKDRENARRQGREAREAGMVGRGAKADERQGKTEKALREPNKEKNHIGHREPGEEREASKGVRCGDNWRQ
jgi:hypothetical protein